MTKSQFWKDVDATVRAAKPQSLIYINEAHERVIDLGNDGRLRKKVFDEIYEAYNRSVPFGGGPFIPPGLKGTVRSTRSRPTQKKRKVK